MLTNNYTNAIQELNTLRNTARAEMQKMTKEVRDYRDRKDFEGNRINKTNEDLRNQVQLLDRMLKQREAEVKEWKDKADEVASTYAKQIQTLQSEMERRIKNRIVSIHI